MTVFQFQNVTAAYGEQEILRNLSFEVAPREILGILGPNGSGKTTLLKLMAGVLPPRFGEITLFEKPMKDYSRKAFARLVSVLPQDTVIDFPFSAMEVVLMGRSPYLKTFQWETQHDIEIARAAMKLTDCLEFADKDIRVLSGGERERVLLARSLAQEPKVLLLDDPTTHLDLRHWLATFRLIQSLNREQGITVVLVLHDLNFASLACQRVLLLAEKSVQGLGAPEEVLRPSLIERVYGTPVVENSASGRPIFLPRWDEPA